ncbi:MAG: NAD-dependent protein deacylase [Gammaproteobacteria bacterium]|nr:MAG: NAD-dependent protein deacylase [Gammaproteobacteria bacterium]
MHNAPYQSIVVLTGAGISAESGIRTFRASDGLWEEHRIEDVASPEGFVRDPATVHRFYNLRRDQLLHQGVAPNPAHRALAEFENRFPGTFTLVTQNIDNLHEQAGSKKPLHMHGELLKIRCQHSGRIFECRDDTSTESICQCCGIPGQLRPHVVWFGEMPLYMDDIYRTLEQCDLFIAIGTSGNVYPAAGFFEVARTAGAHTVELNLEPSANGSRFDEQRYGLASVIVPAYLDELGT